MTETSTHDAVRDTPRHPIRVVSERTGLSADVLRAWQKRYGVVKPGRSERGQRLYSDAEVDRLKLLSTALRAGRSIGSIAHLDADSLAAMIAEDEKARADIGLRPRMSSSNADLVASGLEAVAALEAEQLDAVLRRGLVMMSVPRFLDEVATPLFHEIGEKWAAGDLTPAHEHMASAVMRRVLEWVIAACEPRPGAPRIVVTTPPGDMHEIGALIAATTAASEGWNVTYLGANLPPLDTANAVRQSKAEYVGMSAVFADSADTLARSIHQLRDHLPSNVLLIAGGAAIATVPIKSLIRPGVIVMPELRDFRTFLHEQLRN